MFRYSRRSKACDRCRVKKVKCDESTPECSRCRKAGTYCRGLIQGSIFVHNRLERDRFVQVPAAIAPQTPESSESREDRSTTIVSMPTTEPAGSHSPLSLVGQGRVDPFSAIARKTTARENFLIDFYLCDLISNFGGNSSARFHPPRDVTFNTAMQGVAATEVIFAYAAGHLARKMGKPDTEERIYQLSSIQSINEAVSDPSRRFLSPTIMSILGSLNILLQLRPRPFSSEVQKEVSLHVQGLRELIKGRGGYMTICDDPSISWMTVYTDLLVSGELSAASTPLSAHVLSPSRSLLPGLGTDCTPVSSLYSYPLRILAEEYVGAFRNFFHESQRRLHSINATEKVSIDKGCILISQLFRPSTSIYLLLSKPTNVAARTPTAVLFLLNVILWDCRHELISAFDGYFKTLRFTMVEEGLDLGGTTDRFLWILFTNPRTHTVDGPDLERLWLVSRLLRIHAMLSDQLQVIGEKKLFSFLISENDDRNQYLSQETFYSDVMSELGVV